MKRSEDKIKAETIWVAEWESPNLMVKAFNLDYSWAIDSELDKVLHGQASASEARKVWEEQDAKYPRGSIRMRFSDNHDERRAIARFGEKGALAAQALAFTLDGVPMLYNGMEAGDTTESGAPALFEKLQILWPFAERRQEFPKFYSGTIALRKSSLALRRGDLVCVRNSDESRVLTFTRRAGNGEVLVAINMTHSPLFVSVDAGGTFEAIKRNVPNRVATVPTIGLDAWGFRIFRRK